TVHASSPYEISEDQKTDRPVDHEAQDHESNPDRLRYFVELVELRGDIHGEPHVNVTYIYMRHWGRIVKAEAVNKDIYQQYQRITWTAVYGFSAAGPMSPSPSR